MHEYVYADRILQTVLDQSGRGKKPRAVEVEVGELLGLTRDSLSSAYSVLSKGTKAEGSTLKVVFARGVVSCSSCNFEGHFATKGHHHVDPVFACPECGAPLKVKSGMEVELKVIRWEGGPDEQT